MIHIGKLIKQKLQEQHRTVVWLAQRLSCGRANVYKIFEKYSIDTEVLMKISGILNFDFFKYYSDEVRKKKNEEPEKHADGSSMTCGNSTWEAA